MLWVKAFHIIAMTAWFCGLLYLPRLFVYHAMSTDPVGIERFKIMEKKLYHRIATPAATFTIIFGIWLLSYDWSGYLHQGWLHLKLTLVILLLGYHIYLGKLMRDFRNDRNKHGHVFYRWMNEVPAVFLIAIVILAVVKPFVAA